jgi:hypothetical protein
MWLLFQNKVLIINEIIGNFAIQNMIEKKLMLYFLIFFRARARRSLHETRRRRRLVFFTIVGLILVVILAISLGTSLGSKKKANDHSDRSSTPHNTSKISV